MKQSLLFFFTLCCSVYFLTTTNALANGDALPIIPTDGSPTTDRSALDTSEDTRALVNPVDVIKEKENQNNRSGFWKSNDEGTEAVEVTDTENVEQQANAGTEDSEAEGDVPGRLDIEDIPLTEEEEAQRKEAVLNDIEEIDVDGEGGEEEAKSNDPEDHNNRMAHGKPKKKTNNAKLIKSIKSAREDIQKPKTPERLWSID